jgi:hypothetical protein
MGRRLAAALVLLGAAPLVAACRPSTVDLAFTPTAGARYSYRYEIEATVTQSLDGTAPSVTELRTTLLADQEVVEVFPAGVRAKVTLQREGGAPRTAEVRLDRAGALQGVDLIEGQPTGIFGLEDLGGVLPTATLPEDQLAPGDRWSIDDEQVVGSGRLLRLGVIDGEDVAVVGSELTQPLDETTPIAGTTAALEGELRATGTTAYDLRDGSLRRATTRARGVVQARIAPPPGIDAGAVLGEITYDIRVRVTRLG